jgi:predicted permease
VGAALRLDGSSGVKAFALAGAVKLLALPLVAIGLGPVRAVGSEFQVVVLFAALPRVVGLHSGHAHGATASVAWLISATTLGSMLTLPGWAAWLLR